MSGAIHHDDYLRAIEKYEYKESCIIATIWKGETINAAGRDTQRLADLSRRTVKFVFNDKTLYAHPTAKL